MIAPRFLFGLRLLLRTASIAVPVAAWLTGSAMAAPEVQQLRLAQAADPSGPVKTETSRFGNWILTCQETPASAGKAAKKACWAVLRVTDAKSKRVVMVWKIGRDGKDVPTLALTTPTGVLVRDGVDVVIGQSTRRLVYQTCAASECEASIAYDQAFANDLSGVSEATVNFRLLDGRQVSVKVATSGADKVFAALKKSSGR